MRTDKGTEGERLLKGEQILRTGVTEEKRKILCGSRVEWEFRRCHRQRILKYCSNREN